ncbi:Alpha/Beta hydrolase protein [Cercophora scortea]|uniref:Alpha/Beta hydrolase protein n=1 Tax=Cercophora scortea TaxID=314031 RepID=A0AAE0IF49_9PEZI|nr:Alpha/Beta hydrolase protein [Cercophora scortea]
MNARAPLRKSTQVFAVHEIPLECDVYDAEDYPNDGIVFLYFHPGGLVCGSRIAVPPWLVQVCHQRKWPLVSASYRLLPQVNGDGLLDDARAAYEFARSLGGQTERRVIVGGGSAGFFLATIIVHHLTPKPAALLSITGIPTFRHRFFNSSVLIPPDPVDEMDVETYMVEPVSVGRSPYDPLAIFYVDSLLPDGSKNPDFSSAGRQPPPNNDQDQNRGLLYDYWLYENAFITMVDSVDLGFDWAADEHQKTKLKEWPVTIFIQGSSDLDVSPDVCADVASALGPEKAIYCEAPGQDHLFEAHKFLEDHLIDEAGQDCMDAVRKAVAELDKVVASN